MNFRTLAYFFEVTKTLTKRGVRFLTGDRPSETTYRDLFYSLVFRTESSNRAQQDTGTFDASKNGHVVMATPTQVQGRDTQPSDRTLAVGPANLPDVTSIDKSVAIAPDFADVNITYDLSIDGKLIVTSSDDTVNVGANTDTETGVTTYDLSIAAASAIPIYYINSNNTDPEGGDGSILNPFNTLDRFIDRIDGNIAGFPKVTERVTAVVQGGSYAPVVNLWRGVDYVFELGTTIDYTGITDIGLFDANTFNATTDGGEIIAGSTVSYSYPNVYGQGKFTGDRSFFVMKDDWNWNTDAGITSSRTCFLSFASIIIDKNPTASESTKAAFAIQGTGYTGSGGQHLTVQIIGNDNVRKARLQTDEDYPLIATNTAVTNQGTPVFQVTNVFFFDKSSSKTNGVIEIASATFGTTFSDCEFQHSASIVGTYPAGYFILTGSVFGFTIERSKFFHGAKDGFTCILQEGDLSNVGTPYFILDDVTYTHSATVGSTNVFIKEGPSGSLNSPSTKVTHTTITSYGAIVDNAGTAYDESVGNPINSKLDFSSGGPITLQGKTYLGTNFTV